MKYISFRKKRLQKIFTISFIVCIVISPYAFSQSNLLNNELILGIRTIAPPVTRFCEVFKETLQENVGSEITVKSVGILNQYNGEFYSRYLGLLKNRFDLAHIDIECGPNSESSGELIDTRTKKCISGVKVSLESNNTRHFQYTDSEGSFIFYFDHSCNKILLRFEADNYEIYERWIDTPNNEQRAEIRLSSNSIQ